MNMNLRLRGYPETIIEQMINSGIVETKTDAIRMALVFFANECEGFEFKKEFVDSTLTRLKSKPVKAKSINQLFE